MARPEKALSAHRRRSVVMMREGVVGRERRGFLAEMLARAGVQQHKEYLGVQRTAGARSQHYSGVSGASRRWAALNKDRKIWGGRLLVGTRGTLVRVFVLWGTGKPVC